MRYVKHAHMTEIIGGSVAYGLHVCLIRFLTNAVNGHFWLRAISCRTYCNASPYLWPQYIHAHEDAVRLKLPVTCK